MQTSSTMDTEGSSTREAIEVVVEEVQAGDVQAYRSIMVHFDELAFANS